MCQVHNSRDVANFHHLGLSTWGTFPKISYLGLHFCPDNPLVVLCVMARKIGWGLSRAPESVTRGPQNTSERPVRQGVPNPTREQF